MRFYLNFDFQSEKLPVDMHRTLVSYIKATLLDVNDGQYYSRYFRGTDSKSYSFSMALCKPHFYENHIQFKRPVMRVVFSTTNYQGSGYILMNSFLQQKGKPYPLAFGNAMILRSVQLVKDKTISSNSALIKTVVGGGICVRNHDRLTNKDLYYSVGDHEFADQLQQNLIHQLERLALPTESVYIECIEGKMVIVRHFGLYIPVTVGFFTLHGPSYILQQITETGIGSRRSQGFGTVEIVTV